MWVVRVSGVRHQPILGTVGAWLGNCHLLASRFPKAVCAEERKSTLLHPPHHTLQILTYTDTFLSISEEVTESPSCDHICYLLFTGCHVELLEEKPTAFAPEYLSFCGPWGPSSPLAHHRPFQVLWGPSLTSIVPTQLLWELIMASCILVFYSYYLGSFSAIWGGWALSLPLTSRQIYEKSVQSTHFLSFVQCLSLDVSLFLSEFSLCLPVSLSVSPVDGWMALNAHVYF